MRAWGRRVLGVAALGGILPVLVLAGGAGVVRGRVIDEDGRPMPGVSLLVVNSVLGITGRGAVSDAAGAFQIGPLPAGDGYLVQATFPGYAVLTHRGVAVAAGQATVVRLQLQPMTDYRERVEVRAQPQIVRSESATNETRFTSEFIDALPILGRNYQDLLALAPGVTDPDGDGNPNIHGSRDVDVNTLVDGVSTSDPLTGKRGAELNIESISEIEIKTSGANAEYGRAQGGFVNIITKSGGNEVAGTFKFYWRGSALDGDGAGIDDPRLHAGVGERGLRDLSFDDFLPFLSLEGPIVRDRAWYFMAHEYVRLEEPVNALNTAFVTGVREFREFIKLTWQAAADHRLALSLNYDPQRLLNQGLNSFTRTESGFTIERGGPILTLRLTSVLSPQVALDTSLSHFDERPERFPTRHPDTNGNGFLFTDFNGNGFIEARERDAGEDYDGDGAFDVFEDRFAPAGVLNQVPDEDRDGDGRLTPPHGCEGLLREDLDCDGRLDRIAEDLNGNGRIDPELFEDLDGDGRLDPGTEDRDGDQRLDDTPFPRGPYPYGATVPVPGDRDYVLDQQSGVISGPFFEDWSDRRRRFTLREDLSIFVPDYWGSHDLKSGFVFEREDFARDTAARSLVAPLIRTGRQGPSTVRALIPAEAAVGNGATGVITGFYVQDHYKPFPNFSLGIGVRFDRELIESFGYTPFEPELQSALYDRLLNLSGIERGRNDLIDGNADGLKSRGIVEDPLLVDTGPAAAMAVAETLVALRLAAIGRLTRHHVETRFASDDLANLYPQIVREGEIDPGALADLGIVPQERQPLALTNHNLAPRLSLSWDPGADGRTKLFATWGRYYDRLFLNTVTGEEGPDLVSRYYLLDESGVGDDGMPNHGFGRILSKAPPSATQVSRGLETPFSDEFTTGFEREIAPEVAVSLTFIERTYRRQLQDLDVNHTLRSGPGGAPLDLLGGVDLNSALVSLATARIPDGRPDLYIHNHFFNQVLRVGNFNEARYRGLELELIKRLARRYEVQASYTYARARGDAESFQSRLGNDPSTVESEPGYLDFDQRHAVKVNAMFFLPRDWQLGAALTWGSGLPYSVVSRFFAFDNVGYQQFRTVFGRTERVPPSPETPAGGWRFVPVRRNSQRNPAAYDVNLRARKSFVLGGCSAAVFLEVFNLLNTDDLRVFTYDENVLPQIAASDGTPQGPLQLDAVRRFGRRFQIGFQVDF